MSTSGKYHISKATGNPNKCEATKRGCPLGGDAPHFDSKAEAFAYIEKQAAEEHSVMPVAAKKEKPAKPMTRKEATARVTERRRLQEELRLTEHKADRMRDKAQNAYSAAEKELFYDAAALFAGKATEQKKFIDDLPPMSEVETKVNREMDLKREIADLKSLESDLKASLRNRRIGYYYRTTKETEDKLASVQAQLKAKREELRGPDKPKASLTSSKFPVNPAPKMEEVEYARNKPDGSPYTFKVMELGGVNVDLKELGKRPKKTRIRTATPSASALEAATGIKREDLSSAAGDQSVEMQEKWKKWNKAELALSRQAALKSLADAGFKDVSVKWSRTADCQCGCSPAFIADQELKTPDGRYIDSMTQRNAWGDEAMNPRRELSRVLYQP